MCCVMAAAMLCGSGILLGGLSSLAIMEDAKCIATVGMQSTYAMAQINPIGPACPLKGSVTHSEDHPVSLLQSDNLCAGLHARALFGKHELAAGEILLGD